MKLSLFQGILLGVFGLSALVGLFIFATHSGGSNKGNNGIGDVVIWGTLPRTEIQSALTTITQTTPNFKGVSYVYKSEATLPSDLATAIITGRAPDLVLASQEDLVALSKYITPIPTKTLPPATFKSSFVGEANLLQTQDGSGYYGIPVLVDPLVMFYNHSILSSTGIAKPPATWEALTGLVPKVAQLTSTKQITRSLIALGTYSNVHDARGIISSLFLQLGVPVSAYNNGGLASNLVSGGTGVDTGAAPSALTFYTQFADPSKVSYTWNSLLPDSQQAFVAGNLALCLGYASEAKYFTAANPNLDFAVAPLPNPATASSKIAYGLLYSLMIPRGTANASGAFQVAAALSSHAEQTTLASATGLAPANLTALSTPPGDQTSGVAYSEALYTQGWLSPMPSDTDKVFSTMVQNIITGRQGTAAALSDAESALNALLK